MVSDSLDWQAGVPRMREAGSEGKVSNWAWDTRGPLQECRQLTLCAQGPLQSPDNEIPLSSPTAGTVWGEAELPEREAALLCTF